MRTTGGPSGLALCLFMLLGVIVPGYGAYALHLTTGRNGWLYVGAVVAILGPIGIAEWIWRRARAFEAQQTCFGGVDVRNRG
jgi:hypothetical protein